MLSLLLIGEPGLPHASCKS